MVLIVSPLSSFHDRRVKLMPQVDFHETLGSGSTNFPQSGVAVETRKSQGIATLWLHMRTYFSFSPAGIIHQFVLQLNHRRRQGATVAQKIKTHRQRSDLESNKA